MHGMGALSDPILCCYSILIDLFFYPADPFGVNIGSYLEIVHILIHLLLHVLEIHQHHLLVDLIIDFTLEFSQLPVDLSIHVPHPVIELE